MGEKKNRKSISWPASSVQKKTLARSFHPLFLHRPDSLRVGTKRRRRQFRFLLQLASIYFSHRRQIRLPLQKHVFTRRRQSESNYGELLAKSEKKRHTQKKVMAPILSCKQALSHFFPQQQQQQAITWSSISGSRRLTSLSLFAAAVEAAAVLGVALTLNRLTGFTSCFLLRRKKKSLRFFHPRGRGRETKMIKASPSSLHVQFVVDILEENGLWYCYYMPATV